MKLCHPAACLAAGAALFVWGCQTRSAPPKNVAVQPPPAPVQETPLPPPHPGSKARPPVAADRATGRGWLLGNQPEAPGYGLYSYLLFGSLPSEATRPLYVAVVQASLGKVEPIERKVEAGYALAQLNLYLIPLYKAPPPDVKAADVPGWIVDNYDYARASRILGAVPRHGTGVYIISVLGKPIDPARQLTPPYLWQDLTHVEPTITAAWIQHFLDQSAKERPWEESMGEKLALDLRNYIELAANQAHVTLPAMATALKWFKPEA